MDKTIDVDSIVLSSGAHASPEAGMCAMELTAYLAGEPHSDHPACASPVIAAYVRSWNDSLGDEARQRLKPYARRVIGTRASQAVEDRRAWMAADWLVREYTPAWLETAGLCDQAAALRALPEMTPATVAGSRPVIERAKTDAAAAWDAARTAARDGEWDAAWGAVEADAWDAAEDAAMVAVEVDAWYAAWADAWAAAWDAARAAARAASWEEETCDEARAAADDKLSPTRDRLIESAHALLDRMIATTEAA